MSHVTTILSRVERGETRAAEELLPLVYEELRKLAATKLAREQPGQTLQPTALVHEAWLRLTGDTAARFEGRGHFFSTAAEAMRRILVERARGRARLKRGPDWQRVDLHTLDFAAAADEETLLAVHDALAKLADIDAAGAELVKLRFFAGLSNVEAAKALGLSERTAKRTWAYARAWLREELRRTL